MTRKTFKDLRQLKLYAKKEAAKVLEDVAKTHVKECLLKAIQRAYNEYSSNAQEPYERRYSNGGLLDPSTIEVYPSLDGLSVRVRQETVSKHGGELFVDVYVTQGNLYNWSNSLIYGMQPYPRDFYEYAKEDLEKRLPKILAAEFKKKGIRTEWVNVKFRLD